MNDLFYLGVKGVIQNQQGSVLLLKAKDYWDLPGGRLQQGETELEALKREFIEETGIVLTVTSTHLGMNISRARLPLPGDGTAGLIFSVYLCQANDVTVTISDEHLSYRWSDPAGAAKLLADKFGPHICDAIARL